MCNVKSSTALYILNQQPKRKKLAKESFHLEQNPPHMPLLFSLSHPVILPLALLVGWQEVQSYQMLLTCHRPAWPSRCSLMRPGAWCTVYIKHTILHYRSYHPAVSSRRGGSKVELMRMHVCLWRFSRRGHVYITMNTSHVETQPILQC